MPTLLRVTDKAFSKLLIFVLGALLFLDGSQAYASSVILRPVKFTPYDLYMEPVFKVLGQIGGNSPDVSTVRTLMKEALSFEYRMEDPLRPVAPEETARRRMGDCKAKALWLCQRMNDNTVLFVIGKVSHQSLINHAWLQWRKGQRWYVLDATNNDEPLPLDTLPSTSYMPLYAYGADGTFRFESPKSKNASMDVVARAFKP